jgi:hypothetical protein
MALGELTRQLAAEAIKAAAPASPAAPPQPESLHATILGQVQAMQRALRDDEELAVWFHAGGEAVRVLEFFSPATQVLVLKGTDSARNPTRVVAPVETLQLVCKVLKVQPPAKPVRIGFLAPRPKSE